MNKSNDTVGGVQTREPPAVPTNNFKSKHELKEKNHKSHKKEYFHEEQRRIDKHKEQVMWRKSLPLPPDPSYENHRGPTGTFSPVPSVSAQPGTEPKS